MIRKITLFALLFIISLSAGAQISSAEIEKSIVRVEVTVTGDKNAHVCTGFVWKTNDQIVTSLHAMRPGGKIWVKYLQEFPREVEIVKVLKEADLVLLKVKPGQSPVPAGVVPFTSFNGQIIQEHTPIYALGYNRGAPAASTQDMKKGYTKKETLETFIPKKDLDALIRGQMPSVQLEIIYCNGSLQPGYSGSPAYDAQGRLVGIGDGGLEEGQTNVSWIIPAKFLTKLESSTVSSLPPDFAEIAQHYSAEVELPVANVQAEQPREESNMTAVVSPEGNDQSGEGTGEEYSDEYVPLTYEEYTPVASPDFEFWLTKNRSLDEMYETSDDPESLYSITDYIESFNVKLDYDNLRFDIMEDVNYGVIVAVPEGEQFYYDAENQFFQVNYDNNPDVDLFYIGWAADNSETDFQALIPEVLDFVRPMIQDEWAVENFTINQDFSNWHDVDGNRKIAHILLISEDFNDEENGSGNVYMYVTLLMSYDKSFMGVASFWMSNETLNNAANTENGLDCYDSYSGECAYFESIIKVFCAAHLTTFAY